MKDMKKLGFYALCAILFACAIIEIVIAAVIYGSAYTVEILSTLNNGHGMIVLMTAAVIVILCTALGIFGSIKSNKWVLLVFSGLTLVNFVLQIAGFSIAFNSVTTSQTSVHLYDMIDKYKANDASAKSLWDSMQKTLSCCGVIAPSDWGLAISDIPNSCCANQACTTRFDLGCYTVTAWYVYNLTLGVAGLAVAMAILQFFASGIALVLARSGSSQSAKM